MLTTKQIGNVTELECILSFVKMGYNVSIPYGEDVRYDYIVDICGKLIRVQAKTASLKDDRSIQFSCRSTHKNAKGNSYQKYTIKEIDYFSTYWNGICYLIPVNECSDYKTLRLSPPLNNQKQKICYAKDYELKYQLNKIRKEDDKH